MREEDISKMDFKELRKEVQNLRDELALMKRKYNDAIYNLDSENFGKSFVVEQNNMKAQIKVTAEAIESKVSTDALDGKLLEYSTIKQTDDKIENVVKRVNDTTDGKLTKYATTEWTTNAITNTVKEINDATDVKLEKYATTAWTADAITSAVSGYQTVGNALSDYNTLYSQIEQTKESITSIVSKNISAYFEKSVAPTKSNTSDEERSMLCLYEGVYYYFNDATGYWDEYPAEGLKTMFKQNSSRFELTGDVSISGDLITNGDITGLTVSTAANILGDGVRLNSSNNSLEVLLSKQVVGSWTYNSPEGSMIQPNNGAKLIISGVTARGTWDFTGCQPVGLPSTVAVFG